ncbi:hypothetical protein KP509_28G000800 [Ceratopteris richardii]|uniref:Peptidase S26 domain-containing protein n=1 Tax=Ceratopteris richardii TaxID=49495 RepID=A0A8T2R8U5_CERRI|nr:hypothetical protein KP509_28G000800 [Ceratopteris richardii]
MLFLPRDHVQNYKDGQISGMEVQARIFTSFFFEPLTFVRAIKGEEMEPTFASRGESLLVRKITSPSSRSIFVGDVILFKDPLDEEQERVRRVAAMEGDQMVSTDPNDLPFALDEGHCWVISDNNSINPTTSGDSRMFGQLPMENIIGRVIYACRSQEDHGAIMNSHAGMQEDYPVIAAELDLKELMESEGSA